MASSPTVADAFANAPASADKTALISAGNTMLTALQNAQTSGRFTANVEAVLQDNFVQWLQRVSTNLIGHA